MFCIDCQVFYTMLKRDLRLSLRQFSDMVNLWFFFILIVSLFPLGISPDSHLLHQIAPGIIWVAALLVTQLSLDRLFRSDFEDGCLEQWLLSSQSLTVFVSAKLLAHWLVSGFALILLSPVLAVILRMTAPESVALFWSLLLGTPILTLVGAIAVGLTLGLRGGAILLSLLTLPLTIPVLIFGAGCVLAVSAGMSPSGLYSTLGALLALSLTLVPWVTAAALRLAVNYA